MGKTVRVYLGVAVVAVIGLIVAVVTEQLVIGLAIVVIAGLGGMFLLRQTTTDEDEFFEAPDAEPEAPPQKPRTTPTSTASEPLATWEPEGLTPWTPPEPAGDTAVADSSFDTAAYEDELDTVDLDDLQHLDALVTDDEPRVETNPFESASMESSLDDRDGASFDTSSFETTTFEPSSFESTSFESSSLDQDAGDRATSDGFANSMFGGGPSIDEDVHSDDDIMAASHATELTVVAPDASDNSELAKLLAKVQSRLAAYE